MKSSKEEQDAISNRWFKRRIHPVIDDACQVALRFLQRYTKGKPIGDPESFARSTMHQCEFAGLEIARTLTGNSSASLEIRASAMAVQVSYVLIYPRNTKRIDRAVLKRLLQEEATDSFARLEMVRLTRALALSAELWQDTNEHIERALGKIGKHLKLTPPLSMDKPSMVIEMADRCMNALRPLISQPPNGE